MTEQLWNANRGAGPLSFSNQDRLFDVLMKGDPGAVANVRVHVTYPDGATSTIHEYTPVPKTKGDPRLTYLGTPNPQPTHYDVSYMHNGEEVIVPTIPNDPAGWKKATEFILQQMGGE